MYKLPQNGKNLYRKQVNRIGGFYMDIEKMRNIIVLKNLPSNLVEEAFVIVKNTKMAKQLQKGEGKKEKKEDKNVKNSIVKEAEMVISNYLQEVEKEKNKTSYHRLVKKYKTIKVTNMILVCAMLLAILL